MAKKTNKPNLVDAAGTIYGVLEQFGPEEQDRVLQSALALLGRPAPSAKAGKGEDRGSKGGEPTKASAPDEGNGSLHSKATAWMTKHGLSTEVLEQFFHFDDGTVTATSALSSKGRSGQKVKNAYLARGVAALLTNGDSSFTDKQGRALCEEFGCYDATNHSKYMRTFKGKLVGSKSGGWKLTTPGLDEAAALIKASKTDDK